MEITPLGDSAFIVRLRETFEDAPDEALGQVMRAFHRLEQAAIPGVIELAPAYTSVAIFFDPVAVARANPAVTDKMASLMTKIRDVLESGRNRRSTASKPHIVEIPVCYDPEFAIDLDQVAQHAQLSGREVIDLHSGGEYRVSCIGFTPGFPFLSGMPAKLATPRRATPRKEIPAGAVGIGGAQTGIYPLQSPGGWNLIGRTPLRLFDSKQNPPALLRAGDRVRFRRITHEEFYVAAAGASRTGIVTDSKSADEEIGSDKLPE